jgi:Nif-specific regulatory protein
MLAGATGTTVAQKNGRGPGCGQGVRIEWREPLWKPLFAFQDLTDNGFGDATIMWYGDKRSYNFVSEATWPRSGGPGKTLVQMEDKTGEVRKLSSLLEISQALSGTLNIKAALHKVLEVLERHHGMIRGAVTLLQEDSGELCIEAANGIAASEQKVSYRLGEGITGRVVESGKPIVVPQISREPLFLNRAAQRKDLNKQELSFISVPITLSRKTVGALGVDLKFKRDRDYERSVKFLRIVGSMIAQALKVHRLVEAERQRLLSENIQLRQELKERYDFSNIIGNSGPMRQVYEQVAQVAHTNTTVLIRGESGTGKELIAHAIHYNSLRAKKPFIKVSCAALPDTLIESELFGYEKGAFTGAQSRKKGRFEMAEGGTLFLDEIGDLNLSTQVKLLRVLQEREFERLGGTETIKVNVRLIAATNKNVEKAIADSSFREDLYYRLNVFTIFVPPLRERKPDVMLLADHFLEKYSLEHGKNIKRISTPAIDMLMSYHWPGNVRELENTIERSLLVCDGNVIHGHHLPPTLQTAEASGTVMSVSLTEAIEAYEKDLIQDALKTTRGNRAKAARLLNSTERIVNYKVLKYSIDCTRFRS